MKLNEIDLNKINVFCSVMKHQGYKGASEELNLTRSAISQSITSLEGMLSLSLFYRIGNRIIPTERALEFYNGILTYQIGLEKTLSQLSLKLESNKRKGILRIGVYLEFAKSKLVPVVERFLTENPEAQIKFIFDSPSRIEKLLENNLLDLSISIFPHRGIKSIHSQILYQQELVMIGHKEILPDRFRKESFHIIPVIDYYQSHLLFKRWWKTHFNSSPSNKINPRVYAATAEMVIELVKRKLGVGVVPKYLVEGKLSSMGIQIIQPSTKELIDFIWLNERVDRPLSALYSLFLEVLKKTMLC